MLSQDVIMVSVPTVHNLESPRAAVCDGWPAGTELENVILSTHGNADSFQEGFSGVEPRPVVGKPVPVTRAVSEELKHFLCPIHNEPRSRHARGTISKSWIREQMEGLCKKHHHGDSDNLLYVADQVELQTSRQVLEGPTPLAITERTLVVLGKDPTKPEPNQTDHPCVGVVCSSDLREPFHFDRVSARFATVPVQSSNDSEEQRVVTGDPSADRWTHRVEDFQVLFSG
jgi:hypothetical protein